MDKELKDKLHKEFMDDLLKIAEADHNDSVGNTDIGAWVFTNIPNFIQKCYEVGKEVGELEGRVKGHALGVKEERQRVRKLEMKQANLN